MLHDTAYTDFGGDRCKFFINTNEKWEILTNVICCTCFEDTEAREKMKLASIHIHFIEAFRLAPQTLNHYNLSSFADAVHEKRVKNRAVEFTRGHASRNTCLIHSSNLDAMTIRKLTQIQINSLKCNYSKSASMTSHGLCTVPSTTEYRREEAR